MQAAVWQKLGHAALETEQWQIAATAFRRFTTSEPDGFESWNNLGQVYLKLGNKRSAQQAFVEALRCNYHDWKAWENLLVVSVEISQFLDVIKAYHRLLDLKEKYLNMDVLDVLVFEVCNNVNENVDSSNNSLTQKARGLLGRLISIYPNEGMLWELFANLSPILILRAHRLQKAFKAYVRQSNWQKQGVKCQQVLYVCQKLAQIALSPEVDPKDEIVQSVRFTLSAAISAVKKQEFENIKSLLEEVTFLLAKLIEKAKFVMSKK